MSLTITRPPIELLEEENLSQECKELVSSLPREMSYDPYHFYLYHGFWFQAFLLDRIQACQKHFQAHGDDILLVTLPKSGTTWLKAITFALLNCENHPPKNNHHHPLLKTHPHDLVPFLEARLYFGGQVPDLSSFPSPRLFATHIPFTHLPQSAKDSSCKLVYLCRNPKDTLISLWQFTNKLRSSRSLEPVSVEVVFDSFCRGVSICGPFWDHILDYWRKSLERPEKVLFIKYEKMKEQTAVQFRRLADFLGCPFSHSEDAFGLVEEIIEQCSFENLSNLEINKSGGRMVGMENNFFFRRGEVGDWKNYLTPEMAANLDKICEQKFKGSGLKI